MTEQARILSAAFPAQAAEAGHRDTVPDPEPEPAGTDRPDLATEDELLAEIEVAVDDERERHHGAGQEELSIRDEVRRAECVPVSQWMSAQPPAREWLIAGLVPTGAIGTLIGMGGTGKTNLALALAISMAAGLDFPPFSIGRASRVLVVNVEDSAHDLWRRLNAFGRQYPAVMRRLGVLDENLMIHAGRGRMGPLMSLENGNPRPTEHASKLSGMIESLGPELVILDTKSRLYGLNEDSNDHAAQWVRMLESISQDFDCGLLVVHHVSKAKAHDSSQLASRGASALIDNARYAISLTPVGEKEAEKFGLDSPEQYFALQTVKSNYAPAVARTYFRKLDEGVPRHVNFEGRREMTLIDELLRALGQTAGRLTRREILERSEGEGIRHHLKKQLKASRSDINRAIESALQQGLLAEKMIQSGPTGQRRLEIYATNGTDGGTD